jgi:hypothetical protein
MEGTRKSAFRLALDGVLDKAKIKIACGPHQPDPFIRFLNGPFPITRQHALLKDMRSHLEEVQHPPDGGRRKRPTQLLQAHDLHKVSDAVHDHHHFPVCFRANHRAYCVLCNETIQVHEPRTKFSVLHAHVKSKQETVRPEQCDTHPYHVECMIVHLSTTRAGCIPSCYGRARFDRGHCVVAKFRRGDTPKDIAPGYKEAWMVVVEHIYENPTCTLNRLSIELVRPILLYC